MIMDERKFRILQAIIDDYIMTAIPVGSRTISKKYETSLSSATIRNEMSDLEELGYLDQPHVSAGRIPSAKAYRLYVDQLLSSGRIQAADTESVKSHFMARANQMEDVITHAAKVLSGLTHYTALVMSPKGKEMRVRSLQLVQISSRSALLVLVTDSGVLKDAVIDIGPDMDSDALYSVSRMLTQQLSGHTVSEAVTILRTGAGSAYPDVADDVGLFLNGLEENSVRSRLALGGTSNILSFPEYSDVEKARSFLSVLESKDQLIRLMENQSEMAFTVRIGPETGIPELEGCSLVTASYRLGNQTQGTIGVIGPTRMQYSRVLNILSAMGMQLTELLGPDKE